MIPIRVALEGFMSYRDRAEVVFEGAPLWVLAGRNGAGKSALFDAITYALYGIHRAGTQNAKALVNHAAKGLTVEFDFRVGEDDYRVKRTLGRKGTPTVQAFHLAGPHAPEGEGTGPWPIPETDMRAGFDAWVLSTIGIDARTFTASVLLQQGRSEALLDADPKARHEMLGQIIDLSAYERLWERAEEKHKQSRALAETLGAQLAAIEAVDDDELAAAADGVERAERELASARDARERAIAAKSDAERWSRLDAERVAVAAERAADDDLLAREEEIERGVARLDDLERALPVVERLIEARERLEATRAERDAWESRAAEAHEGRERASRAEARASEEAARARSERETARSARDEARDALASLRPDLADVERLERLGAEISKHDDALARFSETLDDDLAAAERAAAAASETSAAIPWLETAAAAAAAAGEAEREAAAHAAAADEAGRRLEAARLRRDEAAAVARERDTASDDAARRAATAAALLGEAKRQIERFDAIGDAPSCGYCGQPLTPEHIETERAKRDEELAAAAREAESASLAEREASEASEAARARLAEAEREVAASEKARDRARRDAEGAGERAAAERRRLDEAIGRLPDAIAARIAGGAALGGELAAARERAAEAGRDAERLEELRRLAREREGARALRTVLVDERRALEDRHPHGWAAGVRERAAHAAEAAEAAEARLAAIDETIAMIAKQLETAEHERRAADDRHRNAAVEVERARTRCEELGRAVARHDAELPEAWRESRGITREDVGVWRAEQRALASARAERERLVEARRLHDARVARLEAIVREIETIPEAARRPPEEIARDEAEASGRLEAAEAARRASSDARRTLESRKAARQAARERLLAASRDEEIYRELARLLGRDRLQRHLLQRAESGIVELANEVLDRLSSGTIWLELKSTEKDRKSGKALDLVAYNALTGDEPIPVALLSGSQRFRVAVSLALAVGQYAGRGGQRIESVIVDEGFGSLDRDGRREMIDELQALKTTLERIVLVSHQEEFSDAFPNKYLVELVDGTSKVRLADES